MWCFIQDHSGLDANNLKTKKLSRLTLYKRRDWRIKVYISGRWFWVATEHFSQKSENAFFRLILYKYFFTPGKRLHIWVKSVLSRYKMFQPKNAFLWGGGGLLNVGKIVASNCRALKNSKNRPIANSSTLFTVLNPMPPQALYKIRTNLAEFYLCFLRLWSV